MKLDGTIVSGKDRVVQIHCPIDGITKSAVC
jgi:hypothetical protein